MNQSDTEKGSLIHRANILLQVGGIAGGGMVLWQLVKNMGKSTPFVGGVMLAAGTAMAFERVPSPCVSQSLYVNMQSLNVEVLQDCLLASDRMAIEFEGLAFVLENQ